MELLCTPALLRNGWSVLVFVAAAPVLAAQSTWIVDARGGGNFADLPPAVAAAADGDTILVRAAPGIAYQPFTTGKALRVVGLGGPLLDTGSAPVLLQGLPAGRRCALAGFVAPVGQQLRVRVSGCQGPVHLQDLRALEPGPTLPSTPMIAIAASWVVTLHEVEGFGAPAVDVSATRVWLTRCRLGVTSSGRGGGMALYGWHAPIVLTESTCDVGAAAGPAIQLQHCTLRLGGTAAAYVQSGGAAGSAAPAVLERASVVVVDPVVRLNPLRAGPVAVSGNGLHGAELVPSTWVQDARAGATLQVSHRVPPGQLFASVLGLCGGDVTVFETVGTLMPALGATVTLAVGTTGGGLWTDTVAVPAGLPPGMLLAAQGVLLPAAGMRLTDGCTFALQ